MYKISMTGTRAGMNLLQEKRFKEHLALYTQLHRLPGIPIKSCMNFVHGNCEGADVQCAKIAYRYSFRVEARPSNIKDSPDPIQLYNDVVWPAKPPLIRNLDIVDDGRVLFAIPRLMTEENRSGTWHAIRYAKKQGKPIVLFWLDGTVVSFNGAATHLY